MSSSENGFAPSLQESTLDPPSTHYGEGAEE